MFQWIPLGWLKPALLRDWIAGGVQAAHLIDRKLQLQGPDVLRQLLRPAAGDNRQNRRIALTHPCQDHLIHGRSRFLGNFAQNGESLIRVGPGELRRQFVGILEIRAHVSSTEYPTSAMLDACA